MVCITPRKFYTYPIKQRSLSIRKYTKVKTAVFAHGGSCYWLFVFLRTHFLAIVWKNAVLAYTGLSEVCLFSFIISNDIILKQIICIGNYLAFIKIDITLLWEYSCSNHNITICNHLCILNLFKNKNKV